MYPIIPAVAKAVIVVAIVGGGVVIMKKNEFVKKIKSMIPLGGDGYDKGVSDSQDDSNLMARNGVNEINDAKKRFDEAKNRAEEAANRAAQLGMAMKELRSENLKLRTELEVLRRKLEEAKKLSFDYFPDLLKWLQKILGNPEGVTFADNIGELESILLLKYGISVNKDYENIPEGFVCVKDAKVTVPEISLPMLARGDDIELKGIVKVPISFAGAEPPVDYRKEGLLTEAIASDKNWNETDSSESTKPKPECECGIPSRVPNESCTSVSEDQITSYTDRVADNAMGEPIVLGNGDAGFGTEDDFIITTKERTRS